MPFQKGRASKLLLMASQHRPSERFSCSETPHTVSVTVFPFKNQLDNKIRPINIQSVLLGALRRLFGLQIFTD